MINAKSLILFLSGLACGILLMFWGNSKHSQSSEIRDEIVVTTSDRGEDPKYQDLKSKLGQISSVDIEEYLRLKTLQEKYEKADEIFGKILNIFLLDLGIRVSPQQLEALKTSKPLEGGREDPKSGPDEGFQRKLADETGAQPEAIPARQNPVLSERPKANEVNSPDEVDSFLKKATLNDPRSEWRSGKGLDERYVSQVNGNFFGQIHFFDKKKVPWDVDMETFGRVEGKKFVGRSTISVASLDGGTASNSRSPEGSELKYFNTTSDGALLISTNGGDGIIQLYYFPRLRAFSGNFYIKQGLEDFQHTGTVNLVKR